MADIQSNIANLLNDVGVKNAKEAQVFGDFVGALADIGGAIQTINLVVGLFQQDQDPLAPILDAIQKAFQALGEAEKAGHIVARLQNIDNQIGPAKAVVQELNVPGKDPKAQTLICHTALNDLSPDPGVDAVWQAPFSDQIYWTDAGVFMWPFFVAGLQIPGDRGYGLQAPTPDPATGLVFNYTYIWPAYAEVLCIFVAVAQSLFPDSYLQLFADSVLRPQAAFLQAKHDMIMAGITPMSPGQWDGDRLNDVLGRISLEAPEQLLSPGITPVVPFRPNLTRLEITQGAKIEYGAVEKFSAVSSIGVYEINLDDIKPSTSLSPFNKFQIRLLKRVKDTYVLAGLLDFWNTINSLKAIVGDPPLPRPNFADWSFRTLGGIAQVAAADGSISVRALADFLNNTPPQDTPPVLPARNTMKALLNVTF
jgi:hypothetical protein